MPAQPQPGSPMPPQQPGQGWPAALQQAPGAGWPAPPQQPAAAGPGQPLQQVGQGWAGQPQQVVQGWPGPGQPAAGPGWPGTPQPAYPVAPVSAAVTAKRIPEDLPFVARPSLRKRSLTFGLLILFVGLVMACPIGVAVAGDGDASVLFVIPVLMLVVALPVGFQLWLITSGGPVLAVGPDGLWIKTRPTRGQAIWLPWAAIDRIYLRRWALEKMLCVKPHDPRVGSGLGAFTAFDSGLQQAFFGTGFTATVNFADRSEEEIMRAVVGYAAGRCRVG